LRRNTNYAFSPVEPAVTVSGYYQARNACKLIWLRRSQPTKDVVLQNG